MPSCSCLLVHTRCGTCDRLRLTPQTRTLAPFQDGKTPQDLAAEHDNKLSDVIDNISIDSDNESDVNDTDSDV